LFQLAILAEKKIAGTTQELIHAYDLHAISSSIASYLFFHATSRYDAFF
jgi:hypothetical protein